MSKIEVRPTQAVDREIVLAFCTRTWEWGDYIERVWDSWLDNSQGQLFTATADGEPVGIVHIDMLDKANAWLEGLRVNPDYRRQGIARILNEAAIMEAMRRDADYIRLVVHSENTASIQLSESMFMRRIGSFSNYTATPFPKSVDRPFEERTQLATMNDLDEIISYINTSNIFPLTGGVYYKRFKAAPITAEMLEAYITDEKIHLLRRWDRLDGLAIAEFQEESQELRLSVGYIDGKTIEAISLIAYDLRLHLPKLALDRVRVYAPDFVLIQDAFDGAEYESDGSIFYTYERGLR